MITTEPTTTVALFAGRYALAPGYHLLPSDRGWLLYRPDGLFAGLRVKPELPAAVVELLFEESPALQPASEIDESELEEFVQILLDQGVLETRAEAPSTGTDTSTRTVGPIAVEGEGPIATLLSRLLREGGLEVRTGSAAPSSSPADSLLQASLPKVLVCCAGWLPDTRFAARDAWCAEHGIAWHGMYAEGCRFHLGPFWLPDDPRTVRYADARARRLAADAHPDGLETYWRYLDAGRRVPPPRETSPAEAALVAGALADDLLAWADGRRAPSHGHQLALDRTDGTWRRHPVLPVPRGLMTEAVP